jgi:hypothetical protein
MARIKIGLLMGFSLFGIMACSFLQAGVSGLNSPQSPTVLSPTKFILPTLVSFPTMVGSCSTYPNCSTQNVPTSVTQTPKILVIPPTVTVAPTSAPQAKVVETQKPPMPYHLLASSPLYEQNFANPNLGCSWMGVAGQAFDIKGNPVKNLVVSIEGTLNGVPIDLVGLTGANKKYGPGGYEIALSKMTFNSSAAIKVTLLDLKGMPLSDPVLIDTFNDCRKNLIVVNYIQVSQ